MSIHSKLSTIFELEKDETVGYGRMFKAEKKINCATLPIGYADGILRSMSNKLKVIINDKIYSQIGRISMDRISINLNEDNVKVGARVILLGRSKSYKIDAWDWSHILGTIPYEVTCTISKRIPRKYLKK
jgi:alanine racemase